MGHHRFREHVAAHDLPRVAPPPVTPGAFILCPIAFSSGLAGSQLQCLVGLYQLAFQQALAIHQPSLQERALAASLN
jgi:hypothetical protein